MNCAGDLGHTSQPSQGTRHHEHQDGVAGDVDAGIACRAGIITNQSNFVAPFTAVDDQVDNHGGDQTKNDPGVQSQPGKSRYFRGIICQAWQPGIARECFGHLKAGFAPFAEDPVVIPEHGDVIKHERDNNFIDMQPGFQKPWDEAIQRPADHAKQHHQRDDRPAWGGIEVDQRHHDHGACQKSAYEKLTFCADVPKPHAKSQRAA